MSRTMTRFVSVVCVSGLFTAVSHAQLSGLYEFDGGGDGTSWDQATNWERVFDSNGLPISGNPATPPDASTSADIPQLGVVIDGTMPGQTALDLGIGTANGVGMLSMTGGGLTLRDMFVGNDVNGINPGTFHMAGGTLVAGDDITVGATVMGTMTISNGAASTGDDFILNTKSSLTVTGGTLLVGDRLTTDGNASLLVDGGDVTVDDDFFLFGDAQVTVDSGSIVVFDKLRFDDDDLKNGKLTINGGVVRSNEFGFVDGSDVHVLRGVVEINGGGVYQVEAFDPGPISGSPISQLSVAYAQQLIADGYFITSELAPLSLAATSVIVPTFDGRTNVPFTQISLVPEPASVALLGGITLGAFARRR